jgi:hypothetical protein
MRKFGTDIKGVEIDGRTILNFRIVAACIAALALAGCARPAHYVSGQNFGASDPKAGFLGFNPTAGEVACNSCNKVDGRLPGYPYPNDGDGY